MGGGDITAASLELFEFCAGVLRAAGVLLDGVLGRETGVFARAVAWLCCLDVRPLGTRRRAPAGELDLVDAGLAGFDVVPIFLVRTGSREEDEWGEGDCSTRLRSCELVLIGGNLAPARLLCDLLWECEDSSVLFWGPFLLGEPAPRYQSVGEAGSVMASD